MNFCSQLFAMTFLVLPYQIAIGFDDIVSMAKGYDAICAILASTDAQDSIEVIPRQISELRDLQIGKLEPVYEEVLRKEIRNGLAAADFAAKRAADKIAIPELMKILTPEQRDGWRLRYLRRNYKSPTLVFQKSVLTQLGMTDAQYAEFQTEIKDDVRAYSSGIDESLKLAVKSFCSKGHAGLPQKFAELFGVGLEGADEINAQPDAIEVLPESSASEQLRLGDDDSAARTVKTHNGSESSAFEAISI